MAQQSPNTGGYRLVAKPPNCASDQTDSEEVAERCTTSAAAAETLEWEHESDSDGETSRMIDAEHEEWGEGETEIVPMMLGCCCWHSAVRYQLALVTFLCSMVCYGQRVGIAVAIVRMQVEMDWDRKLQGQILAAFFFGYVLMQIPGGFIATRWGPRRSAMIGLCLSSLTTLAIPFAVVELPLGALMVCRILQGFGQGVVFPSFAALWAHWALPAERSRLSASSATGSYFGAVVFETIAGMQCDSPSLPLLGDWHGVFYFQGICGVGVAICWWFYVRDTPTQHRYCSDRERRLLASKLQREAADEATDEQATPIAQGLKHRVDQSTPEVGLGLYRVILTSGPVWAICLAHVANDWSFYVLADGLPGFMRDSLGFDLALSGFLASAPQLMLCVLVILSATAADWLRARCCSTGVVRKLFTCAGLGASAFFCVLLGFGYVTSPDAAVICTFGANAFIGLASGGGYEVNHLDIAPAAAAMVLGVYNTIGQLTGTAAPIIMAWLTPYPDGISRSQHEEAGRTPSPQWVEDMSAQWRTVFLLTATINLLGAVSYTLLGSGERQWWSPVGPYGDEHASLVSAKSKSTQE
jgi:MFS family permease